MQDGILLFHTQPRRGQTGLMLCRVEMSCGACTQGALTPNPPAPVTPAPTPGQEGRGNAPTAPGTPPATPPATPVPPPGQGPNEGYGSTIDPSGSIVLNTIIRDFDKSLNSDFQYTVGDDNGIVMWVLPPPRPLSPL